MLLLCQAPVLWNWETLMSRTDVVPDFRGTYNLDPFVSRTPTAGQAPNIVTYLTDAFGRNYFQLPNGTGYRRGDKLASGTSRVFMEYSKISYM